MVRHLDLLICQNDLAHEPHNSLQQSIALGELPEVNGKHWLSWDKLFIIYNNEKREIKNCSKNGAYFNYSHISLEITSSQKYFSNLNHSNFLEKVFPIFDMNFMDR